MLIYGTKAVHLITSQSNFAVCPSCGLKGSTIISVYSKHFHLFWVPIFPIGKVSVSQCQHCKLALDEDKMPEYLRKECFALEETHKTPKWQFIGTFIFAIIIIYFMFFKSQIKNKYDLYLSNPLSGDVYLYYRENGSLSSFKIVKSTNDSLYIKQNIYEANSKSELSQLNNDENYSQLVSAVARKEIKRMDMLSKIIDIQRK